MQNNRGRGNNSQGDFVLAVGGSIALGVVALPYAPLWGVGGICLGVGGLVIDMFTKNKGICKPKSKVSIIEKLFFENGMRRYIGDGKFEIPEVLSVRDIDLKRVIDIKVPVGMSERDLMRCYYPIKDYFNCVDVVFNAKGKGVYEMVLSFEAKKRKRRTNWDVLWLENGVYSGKGEDVELPRLLAIDEVVEGVEYIFELPIGKSTFHIKKMDITLKEFLDARSVEITHKGGSVVSIKAIKGEIPKKVPFEVLKDTGKEDLIVALGKGLKGYITVNLTKMPNILISGAVGSGKSVCIKSLLMYLFLKFSKEDLHVYISDLKKTELNVFRGIKHVKEYVDTVDDTEVMLDKITDECNRRLTLFKEKGVSNIKDYNKSCSNSEKLPFIFVVIEEFIRYSAGSGRNVNERKDKLAELLFICRVTGISFGLTIQRPTSKNLGEDIKSSLSNIVGLRTVNEDNSKVICGNATLLKQLRGDGHGYLFNDIGTEEFQGFYIGTLEIEDLIREYKLDKSE